MMAVFTKGVRLRHVGHLDIMRTMQRALRRSGLPVSYSNGFSPHILVNFAAPLSVGFSGEREVMEVVLFEETDPWEFMDKMNDALPDELRIISAAPIDQGAPSLMSQVQGAAYTISLLDDDVSAACLAAIGSFMAQNEILTEKKTKSGIKTVDIRPWIFSLEEKNGKISAVLSQTEKETCRPDMLLAALCGFCGKEVPRAAVTRSRLLGRDSAGNLQSLQDCFK